MWHGEEVSVGRFFPPFVEANSGEFATLHFQAAHRGAQNHFSTASLDFGFAAVVKLVEQAQWCKGREGTRQMKWRGQEPGLHRTLAALRIEKEEPVEELDLAGGADTPVEILEIGAAAKGHMLAIVHVFAIGQHVGRCAAAEEGTLFEQTYAPAGFSQRDAGCQPRQPAADHDHAFQGYSLPCGGRSAPWR